jgi:hypothetical protein
MSDKVTEEDVAEFLRGMADGARKDLIPKMRSSLFVLAALDGDPDIKLALEVGMALLLDKPLIIFAVGNNVWVSPRLRQVADVVVEGKTFDEAMRTKGQALIEDLLRRKGLIQ